MKVLIVLIIVLSGITATLFVIAADESRLPRDIDTIRTLEWGTFGFIFLGADLLVIALTAFAYALSRGF